MSGGSEQVEWPDRTPRVRSYSMSCAVGTTNLAGAPRFSGVGETTHLYSYYSPTSGSWQVYASETQMHGCLGPADIWVLLDDIGIPLMTVCSI